VVGELDAAPETGKEGGGGGAAWPEPSEKGQRRGVWPAARRSGSRPREALEHGERIDGGGSR